MLQSKLVAKLRELGIPLKAAKKIRNDIDSHGGFLKESDADFFSRQLEDLLGKVYNQTQRFFQKCLLIRAGGNDYLGDEGYDFHVEILKGSDPQTEKRTIRLSTPIQKNRLAFWFEGSSIVCPAIPFFRLDASKVDEKRTVYVYNKLDDEGLRWITYDRAVEQFIHRDEPRLIKLMD